MKLDFTASPLEIGDYIAQIPKKLQEFLATHPIPQTVIQTLRNMGL